MTTNGHIRQAIDGRGLRYDWVAGQLRISPGHLINLLAGRRNWTPVLRERLSLLLNLPEGFLFGPEYAPCASETCTVATEPQP